MKRVKACQTDDNGVHVDGFIQRVTIRFETNNNNNNNRLSNSIAQRNGNLKVVECQRKAKHEPCQTGYCVMKDVATQTEDVFLKEVKQKLLISRS